MIYNLLLKLAEKGIKIKLLQEDLSIDAPKGTLTDDLIEDIRKSKKAIVEYLKTKNIGKQPLLKKAEKKEYYRLSAAQKRMFLINQIDSSNLAYNMVTSFPVDDQFNKEEVENILNQLIHRHECFRTSIHLIKTEPVQIIHDEVEFEIKEVDFTNNSQPEIISTLIQPFDLSIAPLIRAYLVKTKERQSLLIDIHHIITDGVSQDILTKEIGLLQNKIKINPPHLQYKDYAEYQNSLVYQECLKDKREFWLKELSDPLTQLNLPFDYPRPALKSYEGKSVRFFINKSETKLLRQMVIEKDVTMFMVVLSIFNVFLSKISGQDDILIGIPLSGRHPSDVNSILGMFVNTLPFRNFPKQNLSFSEFLNNTKYKCLDIFENQEYQFDDIVVDLKIKREASRNPIYEVVLEFFDKRETKLVLSQEELEAPIEHKRGYGQFDISFDVTDCGDFLSIELDYCTSLFSPVSIDNYIAYFKNLVKQISSEPDKKIAALSLLPIEESQLYGTNDTVHFDYSSKKTIVDLFEDQVARTPKNVAVVYGDERCESITYEQLNSRANQLAIELQKCGVGPEILVGIYANRNIDTIVAVLGIMKAGGAYLPLDPVYPDERIIYMLECSSVKHLISQSVLQDDFKFIGDSIVLDEFKWVEKNVENVNSDINPNDLAYVIFTSGSTGNPKGVMVEHKSFANNAEAWRKEFALDEWHPNLLQMAGFSFDVFSADLGRSLLNGGKLIICPNEQKLDWQALYRLICTNEIGVFESTPGLIIPFLQYVYDNQLTFESLKLISIGSDNCSSKEFNQIVQRFGKKIRIINSYGVTEATIDTCYYEASIDNVNKAGNVPIGKPMINMQCHVFDKAMNDLPPGIPGELYIGGEGVSRGYLNNKNSNEIELLNMKCFVSHPYLTGRRLYKTGDMARWLHDGNLEFLGRFDDQVKIRGFRIELGEIENKLISHNEIIEAIVLAKGREEEKHLVAYYVSNEEQAVSALRGYLSQQLPDYMIPSYFMHLNRMPLTHNGKVDRRILLGLELKENSNYTPPSNMLEEQLTEIWSKVLKLNKEQICVNRSFFEMGGHSLSATVMVNDIFKSLAVEVLLKEVFLYQNIRSLAQCINEKDQSAYLAIEPAILKDYYCLSSAQQRMYFLHQFDKESLAYNMPQIVKLDGILDKERLNKAFKDLLLRHESLRTSFQIINREPVQKIDADTDFEIEYFVSNNDNNESLIKEFIRPFALDKAPLIRVGLIEIINKGYILIVDMHHIITDGISDSILVKDFMSLYNGESLPKLQLHYKDFAEWQQSKSLQSKLSEQKEFWIKQFEEEIKTLDLPTDFRRPVLKNYQGNVIGFQLSKEESRKLKSLAEEGGSTMFMTLLSIYSILLSKLTNQEDVVIGTPVAGRQHPDLESIIGMFVNTLPLRNYPKGELSFMEFLNDVKSNTLGCFDNQSYQYEELISDLQVERDTSRNPLFDVMFSYQNFEETVLEISGLTLSPYKSSHQVAKFDLNLSAVESDEQLFLSFEYASALFKKETIEKFINYFKSIVNVVAEDGHKRLSEIEIQSEAEKHQLLYTFNDTARIYPKNKTIVELFEDRAKITPDNPAIKYGDKSMSYSELSTISNKISNYLISEHGIISNDLVGIMLEREEFLIVSIFGILKSGGAYVPIDPSLPVDRINSIIADSKIKALITRDRYLNPSIKKVTGIVDLDTAENYINDIESLTSSVKINSDDLAYVIYTSGTTGKPKGVMIEHRSLLNIIQCMDQRYPLENSDSYLLKTICSFDVSIAEIFGWFFDGGSLTLLPIAQEGDPARILDAIDTFEITHINFVPSMFSVFMEELQKSGTEKIRSLKYIFLAGESLPKELVTQFNLLNTGVALENIYGPTESTIYACAYSTSKLKNELKVPIGKPMDNTRLYILDSKQHLCPIGVIGELCIAGDGLSRGYVMNEALTNEKFIDSVETIKERIYRTGDLARWLSDGNIEFVGRIDSQVKIRGFRIELGDIEWHLCTHNQIKEGVVIVKEKDGDQSLVAYYVSEVEIGQPELKNYLSKKLPYYMVPTYFVRLTDIPLTPSGKLNRKDLPDPEVMMVEQYKAPSNQIEEQMVEIWSKVLKLDKELISIDMSFFDLGGNSLKIVQLNSLVNESLNTTLSIPEMFHFPTISSLVNYMQGNDKGSEKYKEEINEELTGMGSIINILEEI